MLTNKLTLQTIKVEETAKWVLRIKKIVILVLKDRGLLVICTINSNKKSQNNIITKR